MSIFYQATRPIFWKNVGRFTFLACAIGALWSVVMWFDFETTKEQELKQKSALIEREISLFLDFGRSFMASAGTAIQEKKLHLDHDQLQRYFYSHLMTQHFARTYFDLNRIRWYDGHTHQFANETNGHLRSSDVSLFNTIEEGKNTPWVLAWATGGDAATDALLPVTMAIPDSNQRYVGTLVLYMEREKISKRLDALAGKYPVSFVITATDKNIPIIASLQYAPPLSYLRDVFFSQPTHARQSYLTPINAGDGLTYHVMQPITQTGLTMWLGFDQGTLHRILWASFWPGLLTLSVVLFITFISFVYMRRALVSPFQNITNNFHQLVEKEAEGGAKLKYNILRDDVPLTKVSQATRHEYISETIRMLDEADRAREWFTNQVLMRIQRPVQSLIKGLALLRFQEKGPLSQENYGQEIEAMHEAALMLAHFASPFLRIEQVDIAELIEKCAVITRKDALKGRLQITYDIPNDLPPLWADRVRLRQVVCSVINQSLLYLPPFRECKVKLFQEFDGQGARTLCIIVEDNGLGFNNMARENARNPYLLKQAEYDVMRLDLSIVQYFLYQHQGSLEIDTKCGTGSRWVIRIPYVEKEVLEQLENDPTSKMAGLKAIEEFQSRNQTIIPLLSGPKNKPRKRDK